MKNLKRFYNPEHLDSIDYLDNPSTSAQYPLHLKTYKLDQSDDTTDYNVYPNKKYKYISKKSDGSASVLYLALETETNEKFIIKKISKNEDWRNELNILKKLKNKSSKILNFINFFETNRYAYIVTEYYKGFDLFEHININVPYEPTIAYKIIKEMLLCIKLCHDNGIVHLDIKCENFMVRQLNNNCIDIVLIDFGHAEEIEKNKIEQGSFSYGTNFYLCPEGYRKIYSTKSDTWSLGICAYLILTGDYPFKGSSERTYTENLLQGNISFSKKLSNKDIEFLNMCLEYDVRERADVDELLNFISL